MLVPMGLMEAADTSAMTGYPRSRPAIPGSTKIKGRV